MPSMDIQRIRRLLCAANIPAAARETGLSERTLYLIKAGKSNMTLDTLDKLQRWSKGRRVAAEDKQ